MSHALQEFVMYILMVVDIKHGYDIIAYWSWFLAQLHVSFVEILVTYVIKIPTCIHKSMLTCRLIL